MTVFRGLFREDLQHLLCGAEPRRHSFDVLAVESTLQAGLESVSGFQELIFIKRPQRQACGIDALESAIFTLLLDEDLQIRYVSVGRDPDQKGCVIILLTVQVQVV
jgi:hypothetical protein